MAVEQLSVVDERATGTTDSRPRESAADVSVVTVEGVKEIDGSGGINGIDSLPSMTGPQSSLTHLSPDQTTGLGGLSGLGGFGGGTKWAIPLSVDIEADGGEGMGEGVGGVVCSVSAETRDSTCLPWARRRLVRASEHVRVTICAMRMRGPWEKGSGGEHTKKKKKIECINQKILED